MFDRFYFAISVLLSLMLFVLLQRVVLINIRYLSLSFDLFRISSLILIRLLEPVDQIDDRLNNFRVLNRPSANHLILVFLEPIGDSVSHLLFLLEHLYICLLILVLSLYILSLHRINILLPPVISLLVQMAHSALVSLGDQS